MSTQIVNIQPLSQPVSLGVEPATFSPEVEAEIDRHLAKYPVIQAWNARCSERPANKRAD